MLANNSDSINSELINTMTVLTTHLTNLSTIAIDADVVTSEKILNEIKYVTDNIDTTKLQTLQTQVTTLNEGMKALNYNVTELNNGTKQLSSSIALLKAGSNNLTTGSATFKYSFTIPINMLSKSISYLLNIILVVVVVLVA
jgi:uncharacterized phage infection (PIP) family protein YhgE